MGARMAKNDKPEEKPSTTVTTVDPPKESKAPHEQEPDALDDIVVTDDPEPPPAPPTPKCEGVDAKDFHASSEGEWKEKVRACGCTRCRTAYAHRFKTGMYVERDRY